MNITSIKSSVMKTLSAMILSMIFVATIMSDSALVRGSEVFNYQCLPKNGGELVFKPLHSLKKCVNKWRNKETFTLRIIQHLMCIDANRRYIIAINGNKVL